MAWPDNHPDDFDIFVQDPLGNMVWYRRREAGFMLLDRDDRGGVNDFSWSTGEGAARRPPGDWSPSAASSPANTP